MNNFAIIVVSAFVLFLLYLGVAMYRGGEAENACLAAGYRESRVDFKMRQYCIRRVDQTDEVIRLDKVRGVVP